MYHYISITLVLNYVNWPKLRNGGKTECMQLVCDTSFPVVPNTDSHAGITEAGEFHVVWSFGCYLSAIEGPQAFLYRLHVTILVITVNAILGKAL